MGSIANTNRVDELLSRLDCLSANGRGRWRAKCPAHGGDNPSSLSVSETSDGVVLLKCWAHDCSAADIVSAVGLNLSDLFPPGHGHGNHPRHKLKWRQDAQHTEWKAAAVKLLAESSVVYVAGKQIGTGSPLNEKDDARLELALDRITQIRGQLHG